MKICIELSELSDVIRESIRHSLLGHASATAPKGYTIAATRRGPELAPLATGELESTLDAMARRAATAIQSIAIDCDFFSEESEHDPSGFVVELEEAVAVINKWRKPKAEQPLYGGAGLNMELAEVSP